MNNVSVNPKKARDYRREARQVFGEYQKNLMARLEEMRIIIRPRPKFVPRFAWKFFMNIFLDMEKAQSAPVVESPQDFLVRKHGEAQANLPDGHPWKGQGIEESEDVADLLGGEELSTE